VWVVKLVAQGTIEERILALQDRKASLADNPKPTFKFPDNGHPRDLIWRFNVEVSGLRGISRRPARLPG
jgi:hypothetical protein